ncbi:MAG: helix-turn-helix transcriptional regulator [Eubacterium sp.]|nr:helix-turn-helix transcriptional regulator [Candidatus Colimonas fimequi]
MSAKKVGALIKKARTEAGLTQEQLARKVRDCSASDISRAERGEKALTQEQLKQIAKATGVTQKSLLEAAGSSSSSSSSSGSKTTTMKLTAAEKKLVELYRDADKDSKSAAIKALKGENISIFADIIENLLENIGKK